MPNRRFEIIHVSQTAYDLVQDLEAAMMAHMLAPKDEPHTVSDAYAALNQRRKDLYQYLDGLEFNALLTRPITLRFD